MIPFFDFMGQKMKRMGTGWGQNGIKRKKDLTVIG
jgi:hypothetical protein